MLTLYAYKNCDTCRKANKWLKENHISYETKAIRETPPTTTELEQALAAQDGDLRKLFNTSGGDYRELGLKDKLPGLSKSEAIALLANNGNLVKRPFLISETTALVGFNESAWSKALL
jgi:arsenate reductase